MTAHARITDPVTSWEAAESIDETKIAASQTAVLLTLRVYGPSTDRRLVRMSFQWGIFSESRIRTARKELVDMGLVRQAGFHTPPNGRRQAIWEATPTRGQIS